MRTKYTKALLEELTKESISVAQVLRKLGLKESGGNHTHIKSRIKLYGIDTSHFLGQKANKALRHSGSFKKKSHEQILVKRESGKRQQAYMLRRALVEFGRRYVCEICGQLPNWFGIALTLQIDHRNGDWLDDRPTNLRFLCPNCHSQTKNFNGKALRARA